ncbi:MAG: Crp/Fnr family transcriptional regulator, partial [Cellulosilyticaceae bacterium]
MKNKLLEEIYKAYPILQSVDEKNKKVIGEQFRFKTIERGEYLRGEECPGFIFIIEGHIKIEKI